MLTRRHFMALGSMALGGACAALAGATPVTATTVPHTLRFGLVQSALWPVDPRHAAADLRRNAERMAETIRAVGPRCGWLAFHDRVLNGGTSPLELARTGALVDEQLNSLLTIIATAAKSSGCWVSFGMPPAAAIDPAVEDQEIAMAISPQAELVRGPWIRSEFGLLGLSVGRPASAMLSSARRAGARAVIAMSAGPLGKADAPPVGIALLEVRAAHADLQSACPSRWLGDSRATGARGELLGHCRGSGEEMLFVSVPAQGLAAAIQSS